MTPEAEGTISYDNLIPEITVNTELGGLPLGEYILEFEAMNVQKESTITKLFKITLIDPCGTETITPKESTFTFEFFKASPYMAKNVSKKSIRI